MTIPDPLVYAIAPVFAATLAWAGRQFVRSSESEDEHSPRHGEMLTVRDYKAITALLDERYMPASELRECFGEMKETLTGLQMELRLHMAEHRLTEKAH